MQDIKDNQSIWQQMQTKGLSVVIYERLFNREVNNKITIALLMAIECTCLAICLTAIMTSFNPLSNDKPFASITGMFATIFVITAFGQFKPNIIPKNKQKKWLITILFTVAFIAAISFQLYSMNQLGSNNWIAENISQSNANNADLPNDGYKVTPQIGEVNGSVSNVGGPKNSEKSSEVEQSYDLEYARQEVNDQYGLVIDGMSKMFTLGAKIEDWDKFIQEVDEKTTEHPYLMDLYTLQAIQKNAPINILSELLNRGAVLNGNHVSSLVRKVSVDEIKTLETYGVDFRQTADAGTNSLITSTLNEDSESVFNYLLSIGVPVVDNKVDLLQKMLEKSEALQLSPSFLKGMISYGAQLQPSHYAWLQGLKERNRSYYDAVFPHIQ